MRHQLAHHQPMPLFTASICSLIQLDREQSTPLYQQICEKLREAILSGQLSEGTRLPTERALAKELGVNRTTVMNAYNQLASEGLPEVSDSTLTTTQEELRERLAEPNRSALKAFQRHLRCRCARR